MGHATNTNTDKFIDETVDILEDIQFIQKLSGLWKKKIIRICQLKQNQQS